MSCTEDRDAGQSVYSADPGVSHTFSYVQYLMNG